MGKTYIDSSIALALLLREISYGVITDEYEDLLASELLELECRRTLDRIRIQEGLPDAQIAELLSDLDLILSSIRIVQLSAPIIKRAKGSFPTVIRSLDALHLATAELSNVSVFLSRDKQQATAAKAMGLKTVIL